MLTREITIKEYPTHVIVYQSSRKTVKKKVNGQAVYATLNKYHRDALVKSIKEELGKSIPPDFSLKDLLPIELSLDLYTVPNHETVKILKNKLVGGKVKKNKKYKSRFDIDNQWIWIKCFTDLLSKRKIIPDDIVNYIPINGRIKFYPVDDLKDRKLVFRFQSIKEVDLEYYNYLNQYLLLGNELD